MDWEATYMDITIKSTSTIEIIGKINYNGDYYGKRNCKRVTGNSTGSTNRINVEIKFWIERKWYNKRGRGSASRSTIGSDGGISIDFNGKKETK